MQINSEQSYNMIQNIMISILNYFLVIFFNTQPSNARPQNIHTYVDKSVVYTEVTFAFFTLRSYFKHFFMTLSSLASLNKVIQPYYLSALVYSLARARSPSFAARSPR